MGTFLVQLGTMSIQASVDDSIFATGMSLENQRSGGFLECGTERL